MAITHLTIRCAHTGVFPGGRVNSGPVFISDLDTGLENQLRKVPCYVPFGGFIDIPATSRSLISFESGVIRKFVNAGILTSNLFMVPESWSNADRPSPVGYPAGVSIWNTDDLTANWSGGDGHWYGPDGLIT